MFAVKCSSAQFDQAFKNVYALNSCYFCDLNGTQSPYQYNFNGFHVAKCLYILYVVS